MAAAHKNAPKMAAWQTEPRTKRAARPRLFDFEPRPNAARSRQLHAQSLEVYAPGPEARPVTPISPFFLRARAAEPVCDMCSSWSKLPFASQLEAWKPCDICNSSFGGTKRLSGQYQAHMTMCFTTCPAISHQFGSATCNRPVGCARGLKQNCCPRQVPKTPSGVWTLCCGSTSEWLPTEPCRSTKLDWEAAGQSQSWSSLDRRPKCHLEGIPESPESTGKPPQKHLHSNLRERFAYMRASPAKINVEERGFGRFPFGFPSKAIPKKARSFLKASAVVLHVWEGSSNRASPGNQIV